MFRYERSVVNTAPRGNILVYVTTFLPGAKFPPKLPPNSILRSPMFYKLISDTFVLS